MAAVVREVTCLVYSDNERNHTALLSGEPLVGPQETGADQSLEGRTPKAKEAMAMAGL